MPSPLSTPSASTTSSTRKRNADDSDSVISSDSLAHRNVSKRAATHDALEFIRLIPAHDAWDFDISELLDSQIHIPDVLEGQTQGNNFQKYDAKKSIFVLAVVGEYMEQLRVLCTTLPRLLAHSPELQPLIVTSSLPTLLPYLRTLPTAISAVETRGNPPNHFLRLGLLAPMGGGSKALDAIVLLDPDGKRRLLLPFGWGAGRHVEQVKDRYIEILEAAVKGVVEERKEIGLDFYEIAKTYF